LSELFNCRAFVVLTLLLFPCAGFVALTNAQNTGKTEGFLQDGFAAVVGRTVPAVVNIASPDAAEFGDELIYPREIPHQGRPRSLGSGVIVSADGRILTSYHVVQRSSDLRVLLWDNRELSAQIVGTDSKTDIAVLKVDAMDLPALKLGISSSVHVGDVALAIGDPLGLRHTVTMGIISATGRYGLGILDYEDFIQTDAAIHPGSSGGALINVRGELIGIVTSGGKEFGGVGFAVPIDVVHSVMDQIATYGRVIRGWLGATAQRLTVATSRAFGLKGDPRGALLSDVSSDGPAGRAGLMAGDIVRQVDGQPLGDDRDLNFMIGAKAPGTVVVLRAFRDGREKDFTVKLSEEPSTEIGPSREKTLRFDGPLGLSVQTVTPEMSQALGLRPQTRGVIVTDVAPASRAAGAEVKEGDIILEVNRVAVATTEAFYAALRASAAQPVLLLIERSGTRVYVAVE
jgi:serine protease Do